MDNDLLNIWLKARNGLPADEARDLVARVEALEQERAEDERLRETTYTQAEYEDGIAAAEEKGRSQGFQEAIEKALEELYSMEDVSRAISVLEKLHDSP